MNIRFGLFCAGAAMAYAAPALAQSPGAVPSPAEPPSATAVAPAAPPVNDTAAVPGATADAAFGGLADIVVTAQRRSEKLQDVPIAISAVTSEQLERQASNGVLDLRLSVPNLNLTRTAGYLSTSLRGVGSTGIGAGVENPVALYVDGVYIGAAANSLLNLNNIAQVEVLKGPQGTLFGRNATGGLLQIITRDPRAVLSGDFNIGYANYDTISGNAYLSGGLGDNVAADLAVAASHQADGWGTNRFNGKDVYKVDHDVAVRSKFVFTPGDSTKITLIGDYSTRRDSGTPYYVLPNTIPSVVVPEGAALVDPVPNAGYDVNTDVQPYTSYKSGGVSLRLDQELGSVNLMSLSAYRKARFIETFDYDYTSIPDSAITIYQDDRQFSQELQLSSQSGGPLTWVVGGYYYDALSKYDPFLLTASGMSTLITINAKQYTRSLAGYAQASYEIFEATKLTLGGRYTTEKRETRDSTQDVFIIPANLTVPTTTGSDLNARFNKFTFRISLDHRFSDEVLGYASFNRGFKSGGFNTPVFDSEPFRPETLDAYEAGLKMDLLDRRVRLNIAGFYYDYTDIQIQKLTSGATTIINGAGAHLYGIDADLSARLTRELTFTAGLGLLHPEYTSFDNCPVSTAAGGTPVVLGSCAGNLLPLASRATVNAALDYSADLGGGTLDLNGNVYYNSGFYPQSDNVIHQPRYVMLGGSAKYTLASGLSIGLFGKNLTNRRIISQAIAGPDGTQTGFYAAPRTYGIMAGFKF